MPGLGVGAVDGLGARAPRQRGGELGGGSLDRLPVRPVDPGGQHVGALWSKPGNGHDAFWPGVDLVLASIISWTPLAADYTRHVRSPVSNGCRPPQTSDWQARTNEDS